MAILVSGRRLLLLAGLWAVRHRWRAPLAALLFFVGTLFPVLGFCNVFPFIYSFVADHFQYLASLGIITLASAAAALLLRRWQLWSHPVGYAFCLALSVSLGTLTWHQSRMYDSIDTLFHTTIDRNPACWMAYNNLGAILRSEGKLNEAFACCRKSLELKSDNIPAYDNLGVILLMQSKLDEAQACFQTAVQIKPRHGNAYNSLGNIAAARGHFDEAIADYRKALELKPGCCEAHNNLAPPWPAEVASRRRSSSFRSR